MRNNKANYDSDKTKKSENRTNNKRSNRGNKSNKKFDEAKLDKSGRDNDPNWYFTSPELANQAAQLSFQNVLGFGTFKGYEIPTIARVDVMPSPGTTEDAECVASDSIYVFSGSAQTHYPHINPGKAGVNLMAAKLYTTLSSFTGRTASYAPQDVAIMILAISSIAELSEHLRRAFGVALTYNYRNRSLPLGLLHAMGFNTDDLISQLSVYRMRFNICMSRINQIPLLENITYIKKSRDLYQKVYMDDPTSMSQLFFYQPEAVWRLDEVGDEEGSILRTTPISYYAPGSGSYVVDSMGAYLDILDELITSVLESSTLNFIYADLLNMANKLKVQTWKFDYLAENYVVVPEFNANALLQFHNMTIVGKPWVGQSEEGHKVRVTNSGAYPAGDGPWITPSNDVFCDADKNNIIYNPAWSSFGPRNIVNSNVIVDMPTDAPSIEDRIEALRWAAADSGATFTASDLGETGTGKFLSCRALPDHYVTNVGIFGNVRGGSQEVYPRWVASTSGTTPTQTGLVTQFEHFPLLYDIVSENNIRSIVGGMQFYTQVDYDYIKRLLNLMYVGLFDFRV